MIGELIGWGVIAFLFCAAFRYWMHNVAPRKDWDADYRALCESQKHASYKNADVTFADYEYQPHALDYEPRPAA